jgi:sugar lactone lactonase YvrE
MTEKMSAELVIDTRNSIGEGPAWDAAKDRLLWTDIPAGVIYSSSSTNGNLWPITQTWRFDRSVSIVVPSASGDLVAAVGTDVLAIQEDGTTTVLAHLAFDPAVVRINDGKCDPQGRLWLGTLSLDGRSGAGAALYRLDADGTLNTMIEDVALSNGLGWSPDGRKFYYIDTPTLGIDVFDFHPDEGTITDRKRLVTFVKGEGRPDGLTVDNDGCLWVALYMGAQVRRYSPTGRLLATVAISAPQATSCCFGGRDGQDLFITSAAVLLPEWRLLGAGFTREFGERAAEAPGAGGVFACRPGIGGPPAVPFGR